MVTWHIIISEVIGYNPFSSMVVACPADWSNTLFEFEVESVHRGVDFNPWILASCMMGEFRPKAGRPAPHSKANIASMLADVESL
jgi:hypothetical protein